LLSPLAPVSPSSGEKLTVTPEERWTKIENVIQAVVGSQAQHNSEIAENRRQIARIGELLERKTSQIDRQIEKNTAAIRDLMVVSRTVIDAQQRTDERMARLHFEIKAELEQLIKAVDAFLKGFRKPNGNQ
jgi:flagellar motility protein MotE (MotC chaperone)